VLTCLDGLSTLAPWGPQEFNLSVPLAQAMAIWAARRAQTLKGLDPSGVGFDLSGDNLLNFLTDIIPGTQDRDGIQWVLEQIDIGLADGTILMPTGRRQFATGMMNTPDFLVFKGMKTGQNIKPYFTNSAFGSSYVKAVVAGQRTRSFRSNNRRRRR